jgi:hypothetical protein
MKKEICKYIDNDKKYKLIVDYGFDKIGNQEPYFTITANLYCLNKTRWIIIDKRCSHKLIAKKLPKLNPLIRWNVTSFKSGPMHYLSNGEYWWKQSLLNKSSYLYKKYGCTVGYEALEVFKKAIVYGSSEEYDKIEKSIFKNRSEKDNEFIVTWMNKRFESMMNSFHKDMNKFGLEVNNEIIW